MRRAAKSFSKVTEVVLTREDLMTFLEEVGILRESLYVTQEKAFDTALKDRVRPKIGAAIEADLKDFPGERQEYLEEVSDYLTSLPQVEVTLGYEPTIDAMNRIINYLRSLAGKPVMVALMVSPGIMGGVNLVVGGNFRDYSLSARLRGLFEEMFGRNE